MKIVLLDQEGEPVGEIYRNLDFEIDAGVETRQQLNEIIDYADSEMYVDLGESEDKDDPDTITPPERYIPFPKKKVMRRIVAGVRNSMPFNAIMVDERSGGDEKSVTAKYGGPDGRYPVGVDSRLSKKESMSEVLEIQDFYRVWVDDPEDVPGGEQARYDRTGDDDGNHYYYELPLETSTRIDIGKRNVAPEKVVEKQPERTIEDVDNSVPESDRDILKAVDEAVESGEPLFGYEVVAPIPKSFENVDSPLTLARMYKTLHDAGPLYNTYLDGIQQELTDRGIAQIDRVSKSRIVDGVEEDDVTVEKHDELLFFKRE